MSFKDHFSGHAANYVKYRPTYPKELYDGFLKHVNQFDLAWDCGTGNGQVAIELANKFKLVEATDASQQQIEQAASHPKVNYSVRKAESIFLEDHSVDLITVGQAIHWFDFEAFFKEVKRVLRPNGILCCWTYKYLTINPELDIVLEKFFDIIESYWPPERDYVQAEYETIPFADFLKPIDFPRLFIERPMVAEDCLNYLRTWSGVKNYKLKHHGADPLDLIKEEFYKVWGDIHKERIIKHPLITKLFRIL